MTTTDQIIALLVAERDRLNRAIDALQGPTKPRGRPPKNPVFGVATPPASGSSKRRGRTAAQRAAQAEKMRAYWAKRRKDSGKN